jgi:hypothetical protein
MIGKRSTHVSWIKLKKSPIEIRWTTLTRMKMDLTSRIQMSKT